MGRTPDDDDDEDDVDRCRLSSALASNGTGMCLGFCSDALTREMFACVRTFSLQCFERRENGVINHWEGARAPACTARMLL